MNIDESRPTQSNAAGHTPACVGLLYDARSNRTFRIPDVPTTSSVAHIKHWYSKNVNQCDPRVLSVLHNSQTLEDSIQVWQLAQGQGQFAVTVALTQSPREVLSLYVDHALHGRVPPINLHINSDSTVLFAKQKLFEMLDLPMGLASAADTTLVLQSGPTLLRNEATLAESNVLNNARLVLALSTQREAPGAILGAPQPPVAAPQPVAHYQPRPPIAPPRLPATPPHYQRIKEIWGSDELNPGSLVASSPAPLSPVLRKGQGQSSTALLPADIFEDEEDEVNALSAYMGSIPVNPAMVTPRPAPPALNEDGTLHNNTTNPTTTMAQPHVADAPAPAPVTPTPSRRSRGGRRSRSPPGSQLGELTTEQLTHLAANFRTKSCRNGPNCKFGRNCWFAHNNNELRRPSDPLPNNLPAVHKLERYSHREACKAERPQSQ